MTPDDHIRRAHDEARLERAVREDSVQNRILARAVVELREALAKKQDVTAILLAYIWAGAYNSACLTKKEGESAIYALAREAFETGFARGKAFREAEKDE